VPIGDILVREEKITSEQRERILEFSKNHDKRFGEAAVAMGLVPKEEIDAAIRTQLEAEMCDLVLWTEAEYEFEEGQPPDQFYDSRYRACSVSCDVAEFIRGVIERRKQWQAIKKQIDSDRLIFDLTEEGAAEQQKGGDDAQWIVLSLVDGKRRVRELIEESGFTALLVFESLHSMLEDRLVRKSGGSALEAQGREEFLEEIRKLEEARSEVMGDIIVRTRLARAYEQISDTAKAAKIWKEIARIHRRKSDLKSCRSALKNAVRCTPEDFNSREQLLEIYRANKEYAKVLSEGRVLADMLFKHNLLNRARSLLANLVNIAPDDARVRRIYALTLLGLGEKKGALKQLRELARILEKDPGKAGELKEVYRRILALDPTNRDIRRKLLIATGGKKMIWITRAIFAGAAVVLMIAGAIFLYERAARQTFAEGFNLEQLLDQRRFDEARVKVRDFQERYKYSTVGRNAAEFLTRIDQREASYLQNGILMQFRKARKAEAAGHYGEAREIYEEVAKHDSAKSELVADARERAARYQNAERAAKQLVSKANSLTQQGKHLAAHRIYHKVRTLYPATDVVQNIRFPVEITALPPGATVYLNGMKVGPSPALVRYSLSTKTHISIEKPGFEEKVLIVEDVLPFRRTITLQKAPVWVFTGLGPIESSPVVVDNTVYVTCRDRNLYAIDAENGSPVFSVSLGIFGDTRASVAVAEGVVAVGTGRGEVLGVDAQNGRVLWRRKVGPAISSDVATSPDGRRFLVTQDDGRVIAMLPSSGDVVWDENPLATPGTGVTVAGSLVYVSSYDNRRISALKLEDGSPAWSAPLPGPIASTPLVKGTHALVGSDDFNVYVVDVIALKRIARLPSRGMVKARPSMIAEDIYLGSMDGSFYCYGVHGDGGFRWRRTLGAPIVAEAAVSKASLYVGATDGTLYCLSRGSGTIQWVFRTGGKIVSRPHVANGRIYLTSMDGSLYALEE
jgi:outer membrane protein assembly factor BamB/tetratricopeptide (TPR) repeat protein